MDFLTPLLVLAALLIPLWFYWNSDPTRRRADSIISKMPGPLWLPFVGSAFAMFGVKRRDIWKRIETLNRDYGPIYRTWNASIPEVHIMEADHMETILRSSVNINKGWSYNYLHPWLGSGLLTSTGQKWHSHRKLLTPTFHFKILENFQEVFVEKSQMLVNKLEKEVENKGFDIYPYISRCTLDIICETAMGTKINAQEGSHSPYITAIYNLSELVVQRFFTPWVRSNSLYFLTQDGKQFKEDLNIVHSFTNKVIRERRQSLREKTKAPDDDMEIFGAKRRVAFLDLLLEAAEGGAALSHEDIREEVDTFMLEGHDTTSASLCWTLLLLGNHPEIQERVFEEQAAIFQNSSRQPSIQDLAEMKYLERVIKESLRLYPSVPIILRLLTEDVTVGEYTIPEGCNVAVHIFQAHRNPKFFPDPEKFDPDNFSPEKVQGRHPYAYVPFSAGSRNCIGQKFALLEEKTVLSALVRKFQLRALDRPSDITLLGELVLRPADGIRLVMERR